LTPPAGSTTPATINGFFNKTSWGKLRWRAHVAGRGGLNPDAPADIAEDEEPVRELRLE
jgi:hypothetical protein